MSIIIITLAYVWLFVTTPFLPTEKCDGYPHCTDSSDEYYCTCQEFEFTCQCLTNKDNPCVLNLGCIRIEFHLDGTEDCPDGSDESILYKVAPCYPCYSRMLRVQNVSDCYESSYPFCNLSTCYTAPSLDCVLNDCNKTDVLCISPLHCLNWNSAKCNDTVMQCSNGEMILDYQLCDGYTDCKDGSDEIRFRPGFKCEQSIDTCLLPQRNLYDDVAHCADSSDLCYGNNGSCFECFDKRLLVSSKQVCNGVIDCYHLSDECLCQINLFDSSICTAMFTSDSDSSDAFCSNDSKQVIFNSSVFATNAELIYTLILGNDVDPRAFFDPTYNETQSVYCRTKQGFTHAILCDERPECRDFSDECECENPASFCNESCRLYYDSFFPFGDRYCDGREDEFAWDYLNKSACPPGFDETLCPKRFYCKSNKKISIDVSQVCNDVADCDGGEDERDCSNTVDQKLFSSDSEMISNLVFRIAFWLNSFLIIIATAIVVVRKTKLLKTTNLSDSLRCQHTIILNITIADFIMGVYLLAIAVHSSVYSGYYGQVDLWWRSSRRCSIIGSLAVISSEASCLLMIVLTAFRLHSTCDPFATLSTRMWPWKVGICVSWIIALTLAVLPILSHFDLRYFLHNAYFLVEFNKQGFWNASDLTKFACRYAAMTNKTIYKVGNELETTRLFLEESFPDKTVRVFGYYSETSVCMPRFFVTRGETAWEYTLIIMTINFLAFISIAVCSIYLYFETSRRSQKLGHNTQQRLSQQESKMQKRIATLIGTDFVCWIPICIMSYVRVSGGEFSNIVYQITAVFLLPINSVLNPFIYSLIPDFQKQKQIRS